MVVPYLVEGSMVVPLSSGRVLCGYGYFEE